MDAYRAENEYQEPDEILIPSKDGFVVIQTNSIRAQESPAKTSKGILSRWGFPQLKNVLQFSVILVAMTGLMTYIGLAMGGISGLLLVGLIGGASLLLSKSSGDRLKNERKKPAVNLNRQ